MSWLVISRYVCQADALQILYEWGNSLAASDALDQVPHRRFNGHLTEIIPCRFVEVTVPHAKTGQQLDYNSFVTNHHLTEQPGLPLVEAGHACWKVENEHNNVLTTKG